MDKKLGKLKSSPFYVLLLVACFLVSAEPNFFDLFTSACSNGQDHEAVWELYTANGGEFSVLMPELPGVGESIKCLDIRCRTKRADNSYAAYSKGVVYLVTSHKNPKHRQSLDEIIAETINEGALSSTDTVMTDVKLNAFKGKKIIGVSKTHDYDIVSAFYMTDVYVYQVTAVGGSRNDAAIQKFFKSFALRSKKGKEIGDGARLGADAPAIPASKKLDTQNSKDNQSKPDGVEPVTIFRPKEVTRKAVIIVKPSPEYTEAARQNQVTGTVTLQIVFASSGKVTNIRTISGLSHGLTEKAIGAARKIYFLPAVKDGKRVSQYIRVEYNFNIY